MKKCYSGVLLFFAGRKMKKQQKNKRVSILLNDTAFYSLVKMGYISKYGKSHGKNFSSYVCQLIKEDLIRKSNLDLEQYALEKLSIDLVMKTEQRNQLDQDLVNIVDKIKQVKSNIQEQNQEVKAEFLN